MIKTKYMFSEAKAKDTASKAKDLAPKAKDMTSWPRGQGHGLEDSISGSYVFVCWASNWGLWPASTILIPLHCIISL